MYLKECLTIYGRRVNLLFSSPIAGAQRRVSISKDSFPSSSSRASIPPSRWFTQAWEQSIWVEINHSRNWIVRFITSIALLPFGSVILSPTFPPSPTTQRSRVLFIPARRASETFWETLISSLDRNEWFPSPLFIGFSSRSEKSEQEKRF